MTNKPLVIPIEVKDARTGTLIGSFGVTPDTKGKIVSSSDIGGFSCLQSRDLARFMLGGKLTLQKSIETFLHRIPKTKWAKNGVKVVEVALFASDSAQPVTISYEVVDSDRGLVLTERAHLEDAVSFADEAVEESGADSEANPNLPSILPEPDPEPEPKGENDGAAPQPSPPRRSRSPRA